MINQEFLNLLEKMKETHVKKNEDYTSGDVDENFNRVAELQEWFRDPTDKTFVGFIAVKLARLSSLLNSQKEPMNESVEDSFLDLNVYCALWAANRKRRRNE